MNDPLLFGPFQTSLTELLGVLFGLVSVWSMKKESIWAFPTGIVNLSIYAYICFLSKYYAYAGINVFMAMMSIYGWYKWSIGDDSADKVKISFLSNKARWLHASMILLFFLILWVALDAFTDSVIPMWDGLTTAFYIIAMWCLAKKRVENWIAWILGDVISIALFAYQGLYFSSLQYLIFTVIAVFGFREWKRKAVEA